MQRSSIESCITPYHNSFMGCLAHEDKNSRLAPKHYMIDRSFSGTFADGTSQI